MAVNTFVPSSVPIVPPVVIGDGPVPTVPIGTGIGGAIKPNPFPDEERPALSNPPFTFIKKTTPLVDLKNPEVDPRILRGYIRRTSIDVADPNSTARLYFMFNPTVIERNYIAYLDQQALDPTNATFGSGNLAAAPGILDFSFELFFDRQIEVGMNLPGDGVPADLLHRGVLVDYDYFDRVVRGVTPDNPAGGVPDNGVLLINPHNITVVFSQDLTVTGRAYNAAVRFEKFSHRMVPTRVRIGIAMKVTYVGPTVPSPDMSDLTTQTVYTSTIPYEEQASTAKFTETLTSITLESDAAAGSNSPGPGSSSGGGGGSTVTGVGSTPGPAGSVPAGQCTPEQVAQLILQTGMRGIQAAIMLAIGWRESSFNSMAHNPVPPDDSYGLFQINMINRSTGGSQDLGIARQAQFGLSKYEDLYDPATSVKCMYILSSNGTNFGPWVIDANTGKATVPGYDLVHLEEAKQIIQSLGGYS